MDFTKRGFGSTLYCGCKFCPLWNCREFIHVPSDDNCEKYSEHIFFKNASNSLPIYPEKTLHEHSLQSRIHFPTNVTMSFIPHRSTVLCR